MPDENRQRDVDELLSEMAYKRGEDPITVLESLMAGQLHAWFSVTAGRVTEPKSFPQVGELTPEIAARRVVATVLSAGWTHPLTETIPDTIPETEGSG